MADSNLSTVRWMTATSEALLRASLHAESQDHVITLTEARRCGLKDADVRALLQAGAWKRLHREVFFVNADLFGEIPRRTVLRAALKRYGDQAVLWGASAAEVYGIQGAPPDERVWVLLPIGQECPQSPSVRPR